MAQGPATVYKSRAGQAGTGLTCARCDSARKQRGSIDTGYYASLAQLNHYSEETPGCNGQRGIVRYRWGQWWRFAGPSQGARWRCALIDTLLARPAQRSLQIFLLSFCLTRRRGPVRLGPSEWIQFRLQTRGWLEVINDLRLRGGRGGGNRRTS